MGFRKLGERPRTFATLGYPQGVRALVYLPFDDTSGSVARVINPALALGRNIVINGDFASDTVWTKGDAAITISGGTATWDGTQAGNADLTQSGILAAGRTWRVTFTVSGRTAGTITPLCGTQAGTARSTNDTFTETITANGADLVFRGDADFDGSIDDVVVKQTNIAASATYPGAELLSDGDMEAVDTSAWAAGNSAALTKETTNPHGGSRVLRITKTTTNNPYTYQNIAVTGKRYRTTGWARSDGNAQPRVATAVGVPLWTGTTSTDWQYFDVEGEAVRILGFTFFTITSVDTEYTEWDDISVREVNPLNGDITGATVNQDAGNRLKKAYLFDGTNDYVDVYSPELNSIFDPTKGTLLAFAKVSGAGVWTDNTLRAIFRLDVDGTNTNLLAIQKSNTHNTVNCFYIAGSNIDKVGITTSTTGWFLVAMTWDTVADELKAYFNGMQSGSTVSGLGIWAGNLNPTKTTIGSINTAPTSVFDGLICHPVLFRDVLADAEILKIKQLGGIT